MAGTFPTELAKDASAANFVYMLNIRLHSETAALVKEIGKPLVRLLDIIEY